MSDKRPGKFKSAILNWLGVPTSLTDAAFWNWWAGEQNAAGQNVNEKTVLTLSAAWACSRLISESVATLPLHLYERTANGRRLATEHPLYRVLHSTPNWASTATTFWESAVAAMLLRGNAFVEMKRVGGRLVSLHFLDPARLQGNTDGNGVLHVRYTDPGGVQREIPNTALWHLPGFSLDGVWGLSTIQYGASVFGNALASGVAANDMFEQGLTPKIAFTMNAVLKKEQRQDFRENFENITGAINAGKPAVLEGGMDAKVLAIPPRDAQLLESRGFSVEEVCRWFRVDPSLVGHGGKDSNWGTGLEQK
ncbi:phage portal protein, partial [Vibrio agarivorans]